MSDGRTDWELTPTLAFDDGDDAIGTVSVAEGWTLEATFGVVADAVGVGNGFVALLVCTLGSGVVGVGLVMFCVGSAVSLARPLATLFAMLDARASVLSCW